MKYGIEVKGSSGKWIKMRVGSRQGPQMAFDTEERARAYLTNVSYPMDACRIVTV